MHTSDSHDTHAAAHSKNLSLGGGERAYAYILSVSLVFASLSDNAHAKASLQSGVPLFSRVALTLSFFATERYNGDSDDDCDADDRQIARYASGSRAPASIHTHARACTPAHGHSRTCTCTDIYAYAHRILYLYIYIYVYVYIHTHTRRDRVT